MLRGGGKMVSPLWGIISSLGLRRNKGIMVRHNVSSGEAILHQSSEVVSPVGENR
jgi:hypothetical protein